MYKIELEPAPGTTFDPYMQQAIVNNVRKRFEKFEEELTNENGIVRLKFLTDDTFDTSVHNISEALRDKINADFGESTDR